MLNQNQIKAIELLVTTKMLKGDIAKAVGVSSGQISRWFNKEEFIKELEKANRRAFSRAATKAQRRLEELVDSKNEQVALGASKELLNYAGYKPTEKVEQKVESTTIHISVDEDK